MCFVCVLGTFKTASKRVPNAIRGEELEPTTDAENCGRGKRTKRKSRQFDDEEEPAIPIDVSDSEDDEFFELDAGMGEDLFDMETM